MGRFRLAISIAVIGLAGLLLPVPSHAADPFVLFLLRVLRDQAASTAIESGVSSASRAPGPEGSLTSLPPSTTESGRLRTVIDDSFIHLSDQQRQDLHASLMRILDDPRNAVDRPAILADFNEQARQVREAHRQLSRLTEADMRVIAAEARLEFVRLPPDQRQLIMQALRQGPLPGMPRALHERMLAEFAGVPAAPQ